MSKKYPLLRNPYESELDFLKSRPDVAGMATEDQRVLFNPYSPHMPKANKTIYKNEASRVYMKKNDYKPKYKLTREQRKEFKDYGNHQDIRETIAGRIYSKDPSSGRITKHQRKFVKKLANRMAKEGREND